ncbi:MAG: glycosyltransferase N-terminal domain-containing protein [Chitinophagaceae bacterium]|nr:glycosyltransferase N-terminal domain-containing protein [Chitinophagaceae bacterium]
MVIFYNFFIALYLLAAKILALWNAKAALWVNGRKNIFGKLDAACSKYRGNIIWMHCASLGEFEQGRPVLESLRRQYPHYKILLTFFSPSGYEIRKNYPGADFIFYLPLDGLSRSAKFVETVQPALAIFIKYEYWYHYLHALKERKIPAILVSAIFRESQPFFKWYGVFWRKMLGCYQHLFVQHHESSELLKSIGIRENVTVSGDTRFDRVIEIAEKFEPIPWIEEYCKGRQVLVAGSTWQEDEEELVHYTKTNPDKRFIIAPHEIDEGRLKEIKKLFPHSIRFSELQKTGYTEPGTDNVLIIDNIGMLARLYKYADVTYVGGGFGGDGIHNILEAAVYGRPVIFGPEYEKFREAVDLVESGGAITVESAVELEEILELLFDNKEELKNRSDIAGNYVRDQAGATKKIIHYIQEKRLLTS